MRPGRLATAAEEATRGAGNLEISSLLTLPGRSAITAVHLDRGRSSGVEHNLAKVRVGRSIRLARSRFFNDSAMRFARTKFCVGL